MKILTLELKNFKGCRSYSLDTRGGNVNLYGDNATFKTTIADAFNWLLFDKDSLNRKDFDIKTLDANNQPIHGLEHEVSAELEINGRNLILRKVYYEKWTKRRGQATAEFTGHTTDYFVNGVPVKKTEYEQTIAGIANEDIFKLLTNPTYFNTQLHWQDRRKILLDVCGDIDDAEVIASDKALAKLPDILQGRAMDDHRKVIAAKRKAINDELSKIPVRIDETQRSLPDIAGIIPEEFTKKITVFKGRIKEKEQQVARIESGGEVAEKTKQLREIEGQLIGIKNRCYSQYSEQVNAKQVALDTLKDKIREQANEILSMERLLAFNLSAITDMQAQMDKFRCEWGEVKQEQFTYEHDDICPTCGQLLPIKKAAEAKEKALAKFNRDKAEKLEHISGEGKFRKGKVDRLMADNAELQTKLTAARELLTELNAQADPLGEEIGQMRMQMATYDQDPAYIQKTQEKETLECAITELQSGNRGEVVGIRAEIGTLENEVRFAEGRLVDIERVEQGQKRIEELSNRERELAAEFEKLEQELYLCEQFVRAKVAMLEERINGWFKMARFKMFDTQVNGGLVECCETLFQGVPFSSLNNAARINVGLDIINTLSEHYGFTAPIFVDNAEAVTQLVETRGQLIRLIVSEADKELRVEYPAEKENQLFKEAI